MIYALIALSRVAALVGVGCGIFAATGSLGFTIAAVCAVWLIMPEQKV